MRRLSSTADAEPVDTNLVHLCEQGFWFCRACHRVTNLRLTFDAQDREERSRCVHCDSPNVKFCEPVFN